MAVGDHGKAVPTTSQVPGQGPRPAAASMAKHVKGSGPMPGTGATAGPSDQAPENVHRPIS